MKNIGIICFRRSTLSNLKPRRTKTQNQLVWNSFSIIGALRKEHLDTIDFNNRHEKFKGSLDCSVQVLLPEATIKLTQVTL